MNSYEQSLKIAINLQQNKNFRDASFYLANALSSNSGSIELVKSFISLLFEWSNNLVETGDFEHALEQLERADSFLLASISTVESKNVETIIHLIKEVDLLKSELTQKIPTVEDDRDIQVKRDLSLFKENNLDLTDECSTSVLNDKLIKLQNLKEMAITLDESEKVVNAIDRYLNDIQLSLQFETVFENAQMLLNSSKKNNYPSQSAMLLQQVEGMVRQLVSWPKNDDRPRRIENLIAELRQESDRLFNTEKKLESNRIFAEFKSYNKSLIADVESQDSALKNGSSPSGAWQEQLIKIQQLVKSIQEIFPKINDSEVYNLAIKCLEQFNNMGLNATIAQQKQYNSWAMSRIKDAMKEGDKHTGLIDDEAALSKSMKKLFGPIDTRFLTHEVNRCYTEVFEHLFSHLDAPDDEEDFKKEGTKLNLLKEMSDYPKKPLSDF